LFLARGYNVFNAAQVEGYCPQRPSMVVEGERSSEAETFFKRLGPRVRHGGARACFLPGIDLILMPPRASFRDAAGYLSTLAHETTHWTGGPQRLNRDMRPKYGSQGYAMEELVAELGAAFLCAFLRISVTPRPDHGAYIAGWLEVLRRDKRAVFVAAAQAQKAVDWMTARAGCAAAAVACTVQMPRPPGLLRSPDGADSH